MVDWSWDLYARQIVGVLASSAAAFLFLALLAFEWMRMETARACREVGREIIARNEAIKKERETKNDERRTRAGIAPRAIAAVVKKLAR